MSPSKKLNVLLIAEQCNPEWPSVPLVAWNYFRELNNHVNVTLVTHERNKAALQRAGYEKNVTFITESKTLQRYYQIVTKATEILFKGKSNWPLYHVLSYPIYAEFNHKVYQQFGAAIANGTYDVVHALTPMMPRYPVKAVKACQKTPFLLGPVNGGVPFPKGFQEKAREEFAYLNFFRALGRFFIPGYIETYKRANRILVGSSYTLEMLKSLFRLPEQQLSLFYENGISDAFLARPQPNKAHKKQVNLIFVGRLVPYKCADIVIEAIGRLDASVQQKLSLTIVGDGSERSKLEARVQQLNLSERVHFAGWVDHSTTLDYYSQSDIFCFPSIREFGGAVVMEAMACGLPCIVANNGGIGEYVTDETGFRIEPLSREFLTQEMAVKIQTLVEDESLRTSMATAAIARAQEFAWQTKVKKIVDIYHELIAEQAPATLLGSAQQLQVLPGVDPSMTQDQIA